MRSLRVFLVFVMLTSLVAVNAQNQDVRPPINTKNAATVILLGVLDAGAVTVTTVAFSPDGKHLVSANSEGVIKVWDFTTGKSASMKSPDSNWVNAATYSPDGAQIASTNGNNIILWDAVSQTQLSVLKGTGRFSSLAYSPDGKVLASGEDDRIIQLWDTKTGKELRTIKTAGSVSSIAFSPDSTTLVSTDGNTAGINFWEVATGKSLPGISTKDIYYQAVTYNVSGTRLAATSSDKKVYIWDVKTRKLEYSLEGHEDEPNEVTFSPDDSLLVTAGYDSTIRLWDTERGSGFSPLRKDVSLPEKIAISADGSLIASAGADGLILFWGVPEGGSLPLPTVEAFTPQPGHWTGGDNSIDVSFDLNTEGKIVNFSWKYTIGTSYCSFESKNPLTIENNAFSLKPDGLEITGKFRNSTTLFGTSPSGGQCGDMFFFGTGGPNVWWVKRTGN